MKAIIAIYRYSTMGNSELSIRRPSPEEIKHAFENAEFYKYIKFRQMEDDGFEEVTDWLDGLRDKYEARYQEHMKKFGDDG